jgi:hypothetical protein
MQIDVNKLLAGPPKPAAPKGQIDVNKLLEGPPKSKRRRLTLTNF